MIRFWLELSKPFLRIGNYFYNKHVESLRKSQKNG
jgi:hypothetical protein